MTASPAAQPVARALEAAAFRTLHPGPGRACSCPTPPRTVLADRDDGTVVRHGDTVAKAHAPDSDRTALARRLAVAAHPALHGILLPPLDLPGAELDGRPVSFWPHGTPVDPEHPESAPWAAAGALLARLHAVPVDGLPGPLPPMRGPAKAARALTRLRRVLRTTEERSEYAEAADAVERAWAGLPPWARDEAPAPEPHALCHGDLHLGQVVRHPAPAGEWLLIDVDDLGLGAPAWDLARPAAWYATGLLPAQDWTRFLDAYRTAGGPALPADGDPWPVLDVPARALTAQTAAQSVAKAALARRSLDEVDRALVESCDRIGALPPELAAERPK